MDELEDMKFYGSRVATTPESIIIEHGRMRKLGGSTAGATIPFDRIIQVNNQQPSTSKNGSYEIVTEGYAPTGPGRPNEIIYLRKHRKAIEQLSKLIADRSPSNGTEPKMAMTRANLSSNQNPNVPISFNGWKTEGRKLRGEGQEFDLTGARVEFEAGANAGSRITATRVVTGGVLFGPIGAIAGGLLRKNINKVYVVFTFADGSNGLIEATAKKETEARKFVDQLQMVIKKLDRQ